MKVAVVGLGKIGLPLAARLAERGAQVTGVDVDQAVVDNVNSGAADVTDEPGAGRLIADGVRAGSLRATADTGAAVSDADVIVVIVRMMVDRGGEPDYTSLDAATEAIGAALKRGACVCYETTMPVGDTRNRFGPALAAASGMTPGRDFHLCFSPERVSAGTVLRDLQLYPKIVGGLTPACLEKGSEFYSDCLGAEVLQVSSLEASEFAKVAETTYRDVNIALANEFARHADEVGVDITEVIRAANSQPYSHIHGPGLGVGGHCIPVYPHFFIRRASDSRLVSLARELNNEMAAYGVGRIEAMVGDLTAVRVLVLGLAFRGGVMEDAFSMAGPVVEALLARGAQVRVHDPLFGQTGVEARGYTWGDASGDWPEALVLQADHKQYRELLPSQVASVRAVLDGRNFLDRDAWLAAGVAYAGIGASGALSGPVASTPPVSSPK